MTAHALEVVQVKGLLVEFNEIIHDRLQAARAHPMPRQRTETLLVVHFPGARWMVKVLVQCIAALLYQQDSQPVSQLVSQP